MFWSVAVPRKASSLISLSVKRNVTPFPCWPAIRYTTFRSSSRLAQLYDLQQQTRPDFKLFQTLLQLQLDSFSKTCNFSVKWHLWCNKLKFWISDRVSVIWKVWYPAMKDASLVRLCFPEPPTPTSRALPCGVLRMREIRIRWIMASCDWTTQRAELVHVTGCDGLIKFMSSSSRLSNSSDHLVTASVFFLGLDEWGKLWTTLKKTRSMTLPFTTSLYCCWKTNRCAARSSSDGIGSYTCQSSTQKRSWKLLSRILNPTTSSKRELMKCQSGQFQTLGASRSRSSGSSPVTSGASRRKSTKKLFHWACSVRAFPWSSTVIWSRGEFKEQTKSYNFLYIYDEVSPDVDSTCSSLLHNHAPNHCYTYLLLCCAHTVWSEPL